MREEYDFKTGERGLLKISTRLLTSSLVEHGLGITI